MRGTLAWVSLVLLFVLAIVRFARDFRKFGEPWVRRQAGRAVGSRIDLVPRSRAHFTDREWTTYSHEGRSEARARWISVVLTAAVVFTPAGALFCAAHFGLVSWRTAGMLLGPSLIVACLGWLLPNRS